MLVPASRDLLYIPSTSHLTQSYAVSIRSSFVSFPGRSGDTTTVPVLEIGEQLKMSIHRVAVTIMRSK